MSGSCEGIDWKALFDMGQSHQLAALIYHQCIRSIPEEPAVSYRGVFEYTIRESFRRRKIAEETLSLLRENQIECFIIKGLFIADHYPNWEYRIMDDADILVADREKAHANAAIFSVFNCCQRPRQIGIYMT